jgi:beta-phosphoglucomutase-like phosphatase (HAD superfamily)
MWNDVEAVDLIWSCHAAGFRLAIGSSGPPENVDVVLDGLGVSDLFAAKITAKQVTRGKPDPQVFTLAAEALRLPPTRCVVVEDVVGLTLGVLARSVAHLAGVIVALSDVRFLARARAGGADLGLLVGFLRASGL